MCQAGVTLSKHNQVVLWGWAGHTRCAYGRWASRSESYGLDTHMCQSGTWHGREVSPLLRSRVFRVR